MNLQKIKHLVGLLLVIVLEAVLIVACSQATPVPTITPTATSTSTPEPTRTPVATELPKADWTDELYDFEDPDTGETYLLAPDEVVNMVKQHYLETDSWANDPPIFDIEEIHRDVDFYYSGDLLEEILTLFEAMVRGEELLPACVDPDVENQLKVKNFQMDGLGAIVEDIIPASITCQLYDFNSQEVIEEMELPPLKITIYVVYDLEDERWKQDTILDIVVLGGSP